MGYPYTLYIVKELSMVGRSCQHPCSRPTTLELTRVSSNSYYSTTRYITLPTEYYTVTGRRIGQQGSAAKHTHASNKLRERTPLPAVSLISREQPIAALVNNREDLGIKSGPCILTSVDSEVYLRTEASNHNG